MSITIKSNGSKFAGENPDTIEQLIAVMRDPRYVLDRRFEQYGGFFTEEKSTGKLCIWGNFLNLSHVFDITVDSTHEVAELIETIKEQMTRKDYLAQDGVERARLCS